MGDARYRLVKDAGRVDMKRLVTGMVAVLAVVGALLSFSSAASASPFWCEDDPIFRFTGGATVSVLTGFSSAYLADSTVVRYDLVLAPGEIVATELLPSPIRTAVHVRHSARQSAGSASLTIRVTGGSHRSASSSRSRETESSLETDGGRGGFPVTVTVTASGISTTYHGTSTGVFVTFATR